MKQNKQKAFFEAEMTKPKQSDKANAANFIFTDDLDDMFELNKEEFECLDSVDLGNKRVDLQIPNIFKNEVVQRKSLTIDRDILVESNRVKSEAK